MPPMELPTVDRQVPTLLIVSLLATAAITLAGAVAACGAMGGTQQYYPSMVVADRMGILGPGIIVILGLSTAIAGIYIWRVVKVLFFDGLSKRQCEELILMLLCCHNETFIGLCIAGRVNHWEYLSAGICVTWKIFNAGIRCQQQNLQRNQRTDYIRGCLLPISAFLLNYRIRGKYFSDNERNFPLAVHLFISYELSYMCINQSLRFISKLAARICQLYTKEDPRSVHIAVDMIKHGVLVGVQFGYIYFFYWRLQVLPLPVFRSLAIHINRFCREMSAFRIYKSWECRLESFVPPLTSSHLENTSLDTTCAICLDECTIKNNGRVLYPCGHMFHRLCLLHWMSRSTRCPYCRRRIKKPPRNVWDGDHPKSALEGYQTCHI